MDGLRMLAAASRAALAGILGKTFGSDRDMYTVLGYRTSIDFAHYQAKYARQDVAKRIIEAPPRSTWRGDIRVSEDEDSETQTPFEEGWADLNSRLRVLYNLERADRVSGIGRYGALLIGLKDGRKMEQEVGALKGPESVLYLKPLSEGSAEILEYEKNTTSERFGQPTFYRADLGSVETIGSQATTNLSSIVVHWTRIIHIAEGKTFDEVFGTPRLESVYNRLDDLEKVVGGTAEMYWQSAVRGLHVNINPEFRMGDLSGDMTDAYSDLQDELDEYFNGLRRVIRTQGVDVTPLEGQTPDPYHTFEMLMAVVSAATGIPKRILTGSERGELASSQDDINWAARVQERRKQFAEPEILRPFLDRMLLWGVLPEPSGGLYQIQWPSLFELNESEKASVAKDRLEGLAKYTPVPETIVTPDEVREWFGLRPLSEEQQRSIEEEDVAQDREDPNVPAEDEQPDTEVPVAEEN